MIKHLLILLLLLVSCHTEDVQHNDISLVKNTREWKITKYTVDNRTSNIFNNYIFSITNNISIDCGDNFDGICDYGVFGGYIVFFDDNQKYRVNILLPEIWNLEKIDGFWDIIVINEQKIYLIRIINGSEEKLFFER